MSKPLDALFDAWDKTTGRDEDAARQLANDYVTANPGEFTEYDGKTVEQLVAMVDFHRETADRAREAGLEEDAFVADCKKLMTDVFLLGRVPKRHVGPGTIEAEVKVSI